MYQEISKNGKYLSESAKTEMLTADVGTAILLRAPVGSGKTTFIIEQMTIDARLKGYFILLVLNRNSLKGQIIQKLSETLSVDLDSFELSQEGCVPLGPIIVCSYQYLALRLRDFPSTTTMIGPFHASFYRTVVFDEVHYLISDSVFSGGNDPLLHILDVFKGAKRIYISATMEPVRNLILEMERAIDLQSREYSLHYPSLARPFRYAMKLLPTADYRNCPFYKKNLLEIEGAKADFSYFIPRILKASDDILDDVISEREGGRLRKAIVFVNSKACGHELKRQLEKKSLKAAFIFSEQNGSEKMSEADTATMKQIEKMGTLGAIDVLITTSVLENGVSFTDETITHLYICGTEYISAVQQAGRVRVSPGSPQRIYLCFARREIAFFRNKIYLWEKAVQELSRIQYESKSTEQLLKAALSGGLEYAKSLLTYDNQNRPCVSQLTLRALHYYIDDAEETITRLTDSSDGYVEKVLSWFSLPYDHNADALAQAQKEARRKLRNLFTEKAGKSMDSDEYDGFREKVRGLYEAATGETLCSGKKSRRLGPAEMKRIASQFNTTIKRKDGMIEIVKEDADDLLHGNDA